MLEARRTRVVLIGLLVVAIALITIDFRDGGSSGAHGIGGRLFAPVEHLAGDVTGVFRGAAAAAARSPACSGRTTSCAPQLAQAQAGDADAAQLASLLHLAKGKYTVVTGTVIAAGGDYSDTVTLNVGSADGITANETVLNGDGLVGTVAAVTPTTATVQLATDAGATVGVRMTGSGQIGALTGTAGSMTGSAALKLTMFDSSAVLRPGQTLVTFGSVGGRPYVPASRSAPCPPSPPRRARSPRPRSSSRSPTSPA